MKVGFAKVNITPRVGVELCGFGPYLHRYSAAVRDNLWAKAIALEKSGKKIVLVSCDLIGLSSEPVNKTKLLVCQASNLDEDSIMVHCTHTHSGPATANLNGWGEIDAVYMETLPYKIAKACIDALADLQDATLSYSEVPCKGIAYNRQYDEISIADSGTLTKVLPETWRPAKPELTDTTCHVVKAEAKEKMIGFFAYFGCHPVVCCSQTHYIHGDYAGIALNNLERENPGAIGIFLQGAQGDVNTCAVNKPEPESMLALDIIAARFSNAVRNGLTLAKPIEIGRINSAIVEKRFSEMNIELETLKTMLSERETLLHRADAGDEPEENRMAMVYIGTLRKIIQHAERGEPTYPIAKMQGFQIGPISLLAGPFETYQAIKNDVKKSSKSAIPLVMSFTNDYLGYAPDKQTSEGYAAKMTPMILGHLPFANIHEELVGGLLELEKKLLK